MDARLSAFLKRLPSLVRTNKALRMIDASSLKGCDWAEGCCLVLAHALYEILGGTVYYIKCKIGYDHAVLRIGDLYIDQDGARTKSQLLQDWEEEYRKYRADFLPISLVKAPSFIPPDEMGYDRDLRDQTFKYLVRYY